MSAKWNPESGNPRQQRAEQPVREARTNSDAHSLDLPGLDRALEALATDCSEVEPPAWLESRIVAAAVREHEAFLQSGAAAGTEWAGDRRGGWFWRPAAWTLATAALLAGMLWMPGWLALQDLPEDPRPGIARIEKVVLAPRPAVTATPAPATPLTATRGARTARRGADSKPQLVATAKQAETRVEGDGEQPGLPPMEWPVEVLAAARQMVASPAFGNAAGYGTEVPLQSVRVRMGANDLWRMGLASAPAATNQAVLADFLVTEEGRPLAVRLVGVYP